jgi:hypothetical protein
VLVQGLAMRREETGFVPRERSRGVSDDRLERSDLVAHRQTA